MKTPSTLLFVVRVQCGAMIPPIVASGAYRSIRLCRALNSNERHSYVMPLSQEPDDPSVEVERRNGMLLVVYIDTNNDAQRYLHR